MNLADIVNAIHTNHVRITDHADEETKADKLIFRGGMHTAVLQVRAEVCLRCGERLYSQDTVRRFEQIRAKLERQETMEFQPLGLSFQIA